MNEKWKFEPDPITKGYINYLDESPIKFDNLKRQQIELIRKEVEEKLKNYYFVSDYKEQFTYLFDQLKDYDFCQQMPLIDATADKEKGIIYINCIELIFQIMMNEKAVKEFIKEMEK